METLMSILGLVCIIVILLIVLSIMFIISSSTGEIDIHAMSNYRERYKRLGESEWFKKHYDGKSLGDTEDIADDSR